MVAAGVEYVKDGKAESVSASKEIVPRRKRCKRINFFNCSGLATRVC